MNRHTPGPWEVMPSQREGAEGVDLQIVDYNNNLVCDIMPTFLGEDVVTANINSRLIASAPELLEACKQLEKVLTNLSYMFELPLRFKDSFNKVMNDAKQAIAKAEGTDV